MRIDPTAPPPPARPAKAVRRTSENGFQILDAADGSEGANAARETTGTPATVAATNVDTLLALQLIDDPQERRRRALHRGGELLDGLDGLKADILNGRISAEAIRRLKRALANPIDEFEDPRLAALLASIEQRAEVELAKLERLQAGGMRGQMYVRDG